VPSSGSSLFLINIIAGHLLLTMLGNNGPALRHTFLTVLTIAQTLLLILEGAIAFIQSYVFAILKTSYSTEVN
jgi:F-type H+-transporting ATPase subunit a